MPPRLGLRVIKARNNFVNVPAHQAQELAVQGEGARILKISWEAERNEPEARGSHTQSAFVSWNQGLSDSTSSCVEIPRALVETLELDHLLDINPYLTIAIQPVEFVSNASRVDVEPLTSNDWEILEMNAQHLEGELLQQVCVVYPGQVIPIWVHGNTLIRLKVLGAACHSGRPTACMRLTAQAEVVVSPKPRAAQNGAAASQGLLQFNPSPRIRVAPVSQTRPAPSSKVNGAQPPSPLGSNRTRLGGAWAALVHPKTLASLPGIRSVHRQILHHPPARTTAQNGLPAGRPPGENVMATVWSVNQQGGGERESRGDDGIGMAVVALTACSGVAPGHISLPPSIMKQLGCRVLANVRLRVMHASHEPQPAEQSWVTLHPVVRPSGKPGTAPQPDSRAAVSQQSAAQHGNAAPITLAAAREALRTSLLSALGEGDGPAIVAHGALLQLELVHKPGAGAGREQDGVRDLSPLAGRAQNGKGSAGSATEFCVRVVRGNGGARQQQQQEGAGKGQGTGATPYLLLGSEESIQRLAGGAQLGAEVLLPPLSDPFHQGPGLAQLGGVGPQAEVALAHLAPTLERAMAAVRGRLGLPAPGCLLVFGGAGCGKTSFVRAIGHAFRTSPASLAFTVELECSTLVGQTMKAVLERLEAAFGTARAHSPALLVLDNIDSLVPADSEEAGAANGQSQRIAERLEELLEKALHGNAQAVGSASAAELSAAAVAVIATAQSATSLHASLTRCGLFDTHVELLPPRPEQREEMLQLLGEQMAPSGTSSPDPDDPDMRDAGGGPVDWGEVAARTEGCRVRDLVKLVRRAAHQAALRQLKQGGPGAPPPALRQLDVDAALSGFTPESLQSAKLFRSDTRWEDVGGLRDVKAELREILEIPVKYRRLFELSPTRLPTGALLYGPPGCGKTLLAGAVARECGLNFISVKGPEVLDKYIGASEQAVRALFGRASSAAPCVLFFDEFDAIAPRRGNDNTGVTDRVVNQLLTFLDGVEGRDGVYVMGATSRPDMIDPALLRPGRLDSQLYCGFPDAPDRLEILVAVSRKLGMTEGARAALEAVAHDKKAQAFTGADLQGLINTAQMEAVHECLERSRSLLIGTAGEAPGDTAQAGMGAIVVSEDHIMRALGATRPSMSVRDRAEYQAAYNKFKGGRKADFNPMSSTDDGSLRTALK